MRTHEMVVDDDALWWLRQGLPTDDYLCVQPMSPVRVLDGGTSSHGAIIDDGALFRTLIGTDADARRFLLAMIAERPRLRKAVSARYESYLLEYLVARALGRETTMIDIRDLWRDEVAIERAEERFRRLLAMCDYLRFHPMTPMRVLAASVSAGHNETTALLQLLVKYGVLKTKKNKYGTVLYSLSDECPLVARGDDTRRDSV